MADLEDVVDFPDDAANATPAPDFSKLAGCAAAGEPTFAEEEYVNPIKGCVYLRDLELQKVCESLLSATSEDRVTLERNAELVDGELVRFFVAEDVGVKYAAMVKARVVVLRQTKPIASFESIGTDSVGAQVFLRLDDGRLQAQAWILFPEPEGWRPAEVLFAPPPKVLYARNRGLVNVSVLQDRCVAIVGLGSGGSTVAWELAKAGVGRFVLIDFDRLEVGNFTRHMCGFQDVGRMKTRAVADLIRQKKPDAVVEVAEIDIILAPKTASALLSKCHLIVGATDSNKSRFMINDISVKNRIPAVYGAVHAKAIGGEVAFIRPPASTPAATTQVPCLACIFTEDHILSRTEEVSSMRGAQQQHSYGVPDHEALEGRIQTGLAADIHPVSNLMVKLALRELGSLDETNARELRFPFWIWANKREGPSFSGFKPLGEGSPTVLKWYPSNVPAKQTCLACSAWRSAAPTAAS